MNEFLSSMPAPARYSILTIISVSSLAGAWVSIGGPVPASRSWVENYVADREERIAIQGHIEAIDKALTELEDGDARDALVSQRASLYARLDELNGG